MKLGAVVSVIVGVLAVSGMVVAFLANASPYVTIAEAKISAGDSLHVVGDLDKASMQANALAGTIRFELVDETSDRIQVLYSGPPPANMGTATKVVVVGGMNDGRFRAHKLYVKCPTKYEGAKS